MTNVRIRVNFKKIPSFYISLIELDQLMETPSILCPYHNNDEISSNIDKFYKEHEFFDIEQNIRYKFKNKGYLIAAFTHPSNFANRLTNCYER